MKSSGKSRAVKLPDGVDTMRLAAAMSSARRTLEYYRRERLDAVKQYAGRHWGEGGTRESVPVNLIGLYTSILSRSLIAKNPRVMLSTFDRRHKAMVGACETWSNKEVVTMDLAGTLQRIVLDALFSIGIAKVALADPSDAALKAWQLSAGVPFVDRVDLDDFVFDVMARDFKEVSFIGHRYRCPIDVAEKLYKRGLAGEELVSDNERLDYNESGDERIGYMGRGSTSPEEFEDRVDLWEVYLPRHKTILTIHDEKVLRSQRWIGPDCGPYHMLAFGVVPGSPMPKSPVMDLIDLHNAVNRSYRKLIRQTDRFKAVTPVRGGALEEGGRLRQASDGDMIQADNADTMREVPMGGPNQGIFMMAQHLKDLFDFMAGNLSIIGGLSPQSKTAAQDKMLNENSSRTIGDMQDTTISFTSRVVKSLTWFWWHHPQKDMKTTFEVPGVPEATIGRRLGPQDRMKGDYDEIDVNVDPYSLSHSTPATRLQFINGVVQQIMPLMPLLQQQGVMFDMNKYLDVVSRYGDEPELQEIFTYQEPPQQEPSEGGPEEPGMPSNTKREYIRRSLGGDTNQARDQGLAAQLRTGGPDGAGMNRPMGDGQ